MREMTDLFYFLGFTIAAVVCGWILVQVIQAIGNFFVKKKNKARTEDK